MTDTKPSEPVAWEKHFTNIRGHVKWLNLTYPHGVVIPADLMAAADYIKDTAATIARLEQELATVHAAYNCAEALCKGEIKRAEAAEAERDNLRERIENALQAAAETARDWEHRCRNMVAMLDGGSHADR
jgi:hypothetical protein